MDKKEIIIHYQRFLKKHNLKPQEFIISSGGACVMFGIREQTSDMDMDVPLDFFDKMLSKKLKTHTFKGWYDQIQVSIEYDDFIDLHVGGIDISDTVMIDGVCCYSPKIVLENKKKMNREKDQKDILALENLIKSKKPIYSKW